MKKVEDLFEYLKETMEWRAKNPTLPLSKFPIKYFSKKFEGNFLGDYIKYNNLKKAEALILILGFVDYLCPNLLAEVNYEQSLLSFMFYTDTNNRLRATGETAQFILAGDNVENRLEVLKYFNKGHLFIDEQILSIQSENNIDPKMKGRLVLFGEAFERLYKKKEYTPSLSASFPAEFVETGLEWKDLILPEKTLNQIQSIEIWLNYNTELVENYGMSNRLKPGFRVLFHGPPGTGKTLAITLLGKQTNRKVFRVDLSSLVSKYIGETEKHLKNLFDVAEKKDWILFFDEADAVFGKRTAVKDSHDRYANQGVSYLLQKVEAYPGMIILASNYKDNIDEAFMRRFQSIVEFEYPKPAQRNRLWQTNLPTGIHLEEGINLETISNRYTLNGSNILNVIQDASLYTLANNTTTITLKILLNSIEKEYMKEDKVF